MPKKLIFSQSSRINLIICVVLVFITSCGWRIAPSPGNSVDVDVVFIPPTGETPAIPTTGESPSSSSLVTDIYIECYCGQDNYIQAKIVIVPQNGTPPYTIPGFPFVESQTFFGNLGDTYSIRISSSDQPPLVFEGDFILACVQPPPCLGNNNSGSNNSNNNSNNSNNNNSNNNNSSNSSQSSSSQSSSSQSSSSQSSSSQSSSSQSSSSQSSSSSSNNCGNNGNCNGQIPECPPPGQGGNQPPGICKKP